MAALDAVTASVSANAVHAPAEPKTFQTRRVEQSRLQGLDWDNLSFGGVYSDHMFVAEYTDGQWRQARIEPFAPLQMSPATTVLHYSQTIFEGLKAYRSPVGDRVLLFRPEKNYERMRLSAKRMCMPDIPRELFMDAMHRLIELDSAWVPDREGYALYVRPFMFGSDEFIGVKPSQNYKFIIFTGPVGAYYPKPVRVKIETRFSRACMGGTGYAKAGANYATSLYPAQVAREQGFDQLIWTDAKEHRYIEEAGTMNVMFVIDGKLRTAPTSETILKGVTRDSVLTLARDMGVEVDESPISVAELVSGFASGKLTEAFGVGTAATIAHIAEIGYEDDVYTLPPVEERKFSPKFLEELNAIRYGIKEDTRGWVYEI